MKRVTFLFFLLFIISFSFFSEESILLHYYDDSQLEILKNEELKIMLNVWFPEKLTSDKVFKEEILLISNHIDDVFVTDFSKNFKGKKLDLAAGEIKGKDYLIKSIPSYINEKDKYRFDKPTNYIFVIEIAGLRIAHFGNIGINKFSDDELKAIGQIDIAVIQFDNHLSDMNFQNEKAFKLLEQIKPKIIIPTKFSKESMEKAAKIWKGSYYEGKFLKISKSKLPKQSTLIILGSLSKAFGKILNLKKINN